MESRDSNRFAIRLVLAVADGGHDDCLRLCLFLRQGTSRADASDCGSEPESRSCEIVNSLHTNASVVFVLSVDVLPDRSRWQSLDLVEIRLVVSAEMVACAFTSGFGSRSNGGRTSDCSTRVLCSRLVAVCLVRVILLEWLAAVRPRGAAGSVATHVLASGCGKRSLVCASLLSAACTRHRDDPAGHRSTVANALAAGVCVGFVSVGSVDTLGAAGRAAVSGSLECLAQVLRRLILLGVSDSLADHLLFADSVDSDCLTGLGEVGFGNHRYVAFLFGDVCRVCAVHADRLDAQRKAGVSVE